MNHLSLCDGSSLGVHSFKLSSSIFPPRLTKAGAGKHPIVTPLLPPPAVASAEVRRRALQDGQVVPVRHRRGSAAGLCGRQPGGDAGETGVSGLPGQLWSQTHQHGQVSALSTSPRASATHSAGLKWKDKRFLSSGFVLMNIWTPVSTSQHLPAWKTWVHCQQICRAFPWQVVLGEGQSKSLFSCSLLIHFFFKCFLYLLLAGNEHVILMWKEMEINELPVFCCCSSAGNVSPSRHMNREKQNVAYSRFCSKCLQ